MIKKASRRRPSIKRRPCTHPKDLPQEPGFYYWSEWDDIYDIYKKGRYLYVNPGVEVRVTPFIAGTFRRIA